MYQQYFVLQFVYGNYKQNSEWIDTVIQTWLFKIQNDKTLLCLSNLCMKIMRLVSHESHGAFGLICHFSRPCREEEKCYSSRHPTLRVYIWCQHCPCSTLDWTLVKECSWRTEGTVTGELAAAAVPSELDMGRTVSIWPGSTLTPRYPWDLALHSETQEAKEMPIHFYCF